MLEKPTLRKFSRLPPRTGIPFSGFDYACLKSRQQVEDAIKSFISQLQRSKSINVALIKAEWGEGKTDAYDRYIKSTLEKNNDLSFSVATSTIGDKITRANELFKEEGSSASKFLACVFAATGDDLRAKDGNSGIFGNLNTDALTYIKRIFQITKDSRIVLFIDEFEEILGFSSEKQKSILSGIKELINGQIGFLHEGGEYSGKFHLIIAVTPYAYNRIKDNPDLAEIFGSFASRLKIIELPQLKKDEIYQYLLDLLKYSYDGKIPPKIPFASTGILNALGIISQRNPRALVQLFCELMSKAEVDDSIKLIDYDHLIQSLKNEEISVYGGSTKCIDVELYEKIIGYLNNIQKPKECITIFKFLTGELKPFSVAQIKERLHINDDEIHTCVNLINQELKKIGIQQAITRYHPLKEEKSFDDIITSLNPGEGNIHLINSTLQIDKLKDEMVFFEFTDDFGLKPFVVFPKEVEDVETIFDLDKNDAQELHDKVLKKYFDTPAKARYYFLSHELISQIFPSPILLLVDFVRDRNKRMELWREVVKNRVELKERFVEAFSDLINKTEKLKIQKSGNKWALKYSTNANRTIEISSIIFAFPSGINRNDINQIKQQILSRNIQLGFIAYIGEIDSSAQEEMAQLPILSIHIRPIRAQQILIQRIAHERGIEINDKLLNTRFNEILNELDLEKKFEDWLNIQRNQGVVIDDIIKKYGISEKDIALACKIFINLTGKSTNLDEVYSFYERVNQFRIYGKSSELNPLDIESKDILAQYRENLLINKFIEQQDRDNFSIIDTQIESRILAILKKGEANIDTIKAQFINLSSSETILKDVYLPILVYKGKISINKSNQYGLITSSKAIEDIYKKFQDFIRDLNNKRNTDWWTFAHVCISKDRNDVKFTLDEFIDFVENLKRDLEEECEESPRLQKVRMIGLLLDHYKEKISSIINNAHKHGEEIYNGAKNKFKELEFNLNNLLENYNKNTKDRKYDISELDEYNRIKKLFENIQRIWSKQYTKDEISQNLKSFRSESQKQDLPFYFKKQEDQAYYFNLKYYLLSKSIDDFEKCFKKLSSNEERITQYITKIENLDVAINGKVLSENIHENLNLSVKIHQSISTIRKSSIEAECSSRLVMSDLENFFSRACAEREKFKNQLDEILEKLNQIAIQEKDYKDKIVEIKNLLENYSQFIDGVNEYLDTIKSSKETIKNIQMKYEKLICNFEESDHENLSALLSNLDAIFKELISLTDELQQIKKDLKELERKFLEIINGYKIAYEKISDIFKNEKGIKELKIELDELCTSSERVVKGLVSSPQEKSWQTIDDELIKFREKFLTLLRRIIPGEESDVLYELVQILPKKGWKEYSEIIEIVSKKLEISPTETESLIDKLVERKIIRKGLSYLN